MELLDRGINMAKQLVNQTNSRNIIKEIFKHKETHKPIHRVERVLDLQAYLQEAIEKEGKSNGN